MFCEFWVSDDMETFIDDEIITGEIGFIGGNVFIEWFLDSEEHFA